MSVPKRCSRASLASPSSIEIAVANLVAEPFARLTLPHLPNRDHLAGGLDQLGQGGGQ